jgi:outer membrane protein
MKANSDKWFFNIDLKKIYLRTDATVDASSALGATVVADVKIDPYVIGVGFGMRF